MVLDDQEEFRNTDATAIQINFQGNSQDQGHDIQTQHATAIQINFPGNSQYQGLDVEQVMVTCGQGWVPDEGHSVPEHEGGVDPGLGGVHVVRPILALTHLHLHELRYVLFIVNIFPPYIFHLEDVESEGDSRHWNEVGEDPPGLRHRLRDCPANRI